MTLPFLKSSRALLAVLLISMPLSVGADNNEYSKFKIPEAEPADFDSIMEVVDPNESGDADEHIPTNLEEAFCGGWDFLLSVETGENLEGDDLEEELPLEDDFVPGKESFIAEVLNVPGYDGMPFEAIHSGMAKRLDFSFPQDTDDVCGFMTACRARNHPRLSAGIDRIKPAFLCAHPCQRPLGDIQGAGPSGCSASLTEVQYTCGGGSMQGPGGDAMCNEMTSPDGLDGGLCGQLNDDWRYQLYVKFETTDDGSLGDYTETTTTCRGACMNTDEEIAALNAEAAAKAADGFVPAGIMYCCTDTTEPNCASCSGGSCGMEHPLGGGWANSDDCYIVTSEFNRAEGEDDEDGNPTTVITPGSSTSTMIPDARSYIPYHRHYPHSTYERAEETKYADNDDTYKREDLPISCYGFYENHDPLNVQIPDDLKNCVIAVSYSGLDFQDAKEDQMGKGKYGENNLNPDRLPIRRRAKHGNMDWWAPAVGDDIPFESFSLLNSKVFNIDKQDFTMILLGPDIARLRSGYQLRTDQYTSSGALIRATDDTVHYDTRGEQRTVVEWWQEQETEVTRRLTSNVRILLPNSWTLDLDPIDPLFVPRKGDASQPLLPEENILLLPVHEQVHAGHDVLGDITNFFKRNLLLRFTKAEIPIVVPMGSPTEFRSYAQGWESWADLQEERGKPYGDARTIASKLQEYADRVEEVRELRTELANTVRTLFEEQEKIAKHISKWYVNNIDAFEGYLADRDAAYTAITTIWREAQDIYRDYHDGDAGFPWCRNDRFTSPIYSMNDMWMPGRPDLSGSMMPRLPQIEIADVHLDLTTLKPSEPVLLPIIKPIEIRINPVIIEPPDLMQEQSLISYPQLPDIPDIPSILDYIQNDFPEVKTDATPSIGDIEGYPTPSAVAETAMITNIKVVVEAMRDEYKLFWESIIAPRCSGGSGPWGYLDCVKGGEEQDCLTPHKYICAHYENDLLERLRRIGARPGVQMREDFLSMGFWRDPNRKWMLNPIDPATAVWECPPEDWACHLQNPLHERSRQGWHIEGPDLTDHKTATEELRKEKFEETLPEEGNDEDFQYIVPSSELLPTYAIPPEVHILTGSTAPQD